MFRYDNDTAVLSPPDSGGTASRDIEQRRRDRSPRVIGARAPSMATVFEFNPTLRGV